MEKITLPPSSDPLRSSLFPHSQLTACLIFEPVEYDPILDWAKRSTTITTLQYDTIISRWRLREIAILKHRLIAQWKEHLQWQPTLLVCEAQNGFASQPCFTTFTTTAPLLVNDLKTTIRGLTTLVFDLYNNNNPNRSNPNGSNPVKSMLLEFLSRTPPRDQPGQASDHLIYFTNSAAPQLLVMLYTSSHQPNTDLANHAIRELILQSTNYEDRLPNYKHALALLFSNWLSWAAGIYDPLYVFCCSNLNDNDKKKNGLRELANRLLHDLELSKKKSVYSFYVGPALRDVKDLAAFLVLVKNEIMALHLRGGGGPVVHQMREGELCSLPLSYAEDISCLHRVFLELLHKLDECMVIIEEDGGMQHDGQTQCCHYLAILKELNTISKLYQGAEEVFWETMKQRKVALYYLIVRFVNRIDDHKWILEAAKEATTFETLMMFPEVEHRHRYAEEMLQLLIDRMIIK